MEGIWKKFQNHSLRYKMTVLLFLLVLLLQIVNGLIFNSIVSKKFEKNITQSNLATVNQLASNTNRMFKDIVTEMIAIREELMSTQAVSGESESPGESASRNIVYQEYFNQLVAKENNYQFVNSMLILKEWGRNYYYTLREYMKLKDTSLFRQVIDDYTFREQCHWGRMTEESYFFTAGDKKLISIIMPIYHYHKAEQLLIVNLEAEALVEYLEQLNAEQAVDNQILLQLNDGSILGLHKEKAEDGELVEMLSSAGQSEITAGKKYSLITNKLQINGWMLSMVVPLSSINNTTKTMTQFIPIIIFTTAIALLAGITFIVSTITKPIRKMTVIMEENRHTRAMDHRFPAKYSDEVGVLARTYNQLMDEIKELVDEIEKEQIQNRNAYFKLLQLQIKPHFLYNTLESAKFMVEMKDPKGVEMLTAIGKFYKLSLSGIYDKVNVREEIEHLTCYLQILQMRYSSKYDYEVDVPEEIMENEIVKFTLQPLVENAVYHGVKQQRSKGLIKITGRGYEKGIKISITDNGAGIPLPKLKELQKQIAASKGVKMREHIGILNVHQRLQVQYGQEYGLEIDSCQGEYTKVCIRIPRSGYKERFSDRDGGERDV